MRREREWFGVWTWAVVVVLLGTAAAPAQYPNGSILAWGAQVFGVDLSAGFVAVAGGYLHSLGLKADGSIVAWGYDGWGQCDVEAPNRDFVAVAGGGNHSLGLKVDSSIRAWGNNDYGLPTIVTPTHTSPKLNAWLTWS